MNERFELPVDGNSAAGALNRRAFLTRAAVAGLSVSALATAVSAQAPQPVPDAGPLVPAPGAPTNESEYRLALIGPATLSLLSSQLASTRATNSGVKQFAIFELSEATNVTAVLKDMGTPTPALDPVAAELMATLNAAQGVDFDRAYIQSQHEAHVLLRTLAQTYLANSRSDKLEEKHGRHMAMLQLPTITEHISHTQQLTLELGR